MKVKPTFLLLAVGIVSTGLSGALAAWQPGSIPEAPARMQSSGFSVDNFDRNDVVAFWHAVYQASEGYESRIGWTGNYTGNSGTTSSAFVKDVERRLNYFRAMCGVPANARVNTGATVTIEASDRFKPAGSTPKAMAAQRAALMLVRNYDTLTGYNPAITHDPPPNIVDWSPETWNAHARGNLAFGSFGPWAITEYMIERAQGNGAISSWNHLAGHRRWNLLPGATDYATGDQPGSSAFRPPTNVFYVMQKPSELAVAAPKFVAYPAAGFFPVAINSPYWSLSRAGADFSAATVKMTGPTGADISLKSVKWSNHYGDPAIIWEVTGAPAAQSLLKDATYQIRVTGIGGAGVPSSHSYSVTLINPDLLISKRKISGAGTVAATASRTFTYPRQHGAEGLKMVISRTNRQAWIEDAEAPGEAKVIDGTSPTYPLMVKPSSFTGFGGVAGTMAFRLTFPDSYDMVATGIPDQWFELDRDLVAQKGATLSFKFRRGYMTTSSTLMLETSANGGVSWKRLGSAIKGVSNTHYETKVSSASLPLPVSTKPIRIRFRYVAGSGSIFTHAAAPNSPTGIFIDEITTSKCDWWEIRKERVRPTGSKKFAFNSKTAGSTLKKGEVWQLRLRNQFGGHGFPPGPAKRVTITD